MCILREIYTKILWINIWFALWSSTRSFLCSNNVKVNARFLMAHTYVTITITIHPCIVLELWTSLSAAFILFFPNSSLSSSTGLFPWPLGPYMSILIKSKKVGCCFFLSSPLQIEEFFSLAFDRNRDVSWQYYFFQHICMMLSSSWPMSETDLSSL